MKRNDELRLQAVKMREEGCTHQEIREKLGVSSKGTMSNWLQGVKVPEGYTEKISKKRSDNMIRIRNTPKWTESRLRFDENRRKKPICNIAGVDYYKCTQCFEIKTAEEFSYGIRRGLLRISSWCKSCMRKWYNDLRNSAIEKLGSRCACGCAISELIEIHHIYGNGEEERKEISRTTFLRKIKGMTTENAKREYELRCVVCHLAKHTEIRNVGIRYDIKMVCVPER